MLEHAEDDILAFYASPPDHWRKLKSTNPLTLRRTVATAFRGTARAGGS
jgi:transposase-like protein